jgi:S-adenosylmethionine hydrolase
MRPFTRRLAFFLAGLLGSAHGLASGVAPVLQTDFGTKDGAVAAMKGVAVGVSPRLMIHDLSHENTPFDIWEAAYRLKQTASYWPAGTVFVSVVDPGVGSARKSVVLRTGSGHLFVGPDNGTWTLVAEDLGVAEVREIDTVRHLRSGSANSYTFHGRDLYVLVGAKLAAGQITMAEVGPPLLGGVVRLPHEQARLAGGVLHGGIPALDVRYGNVWTNIGESLLAELVPVPGDRFRVRIDRGATPIYEGEMPYVRTFADVPEGAPFLYLNSLMNVSFALNMDSFASRHEIASGADWRVRVEKVTP